MSAGRRTGRDTLSMLLRVALAVVFFAAAASKLSDAQLYPFGCYEGARLFGQRIALQGVVPAPLAMPLAVAVIAAEFALALWLLSHHRPRWALAACAGVLIAFCAYLVVAVVIGGAEDCGCFASFGSVDPLLAVARNGVLAAAVALAFFLGRSGENRRGTPAA